tara:strand:+ start:405 stop:2849 length:2445 start_codon:yes stop_codon:yes gene_type:complete
MALFTGHTITPDSALGGTQIQRSLRFDGSNNNNISRTPSSTGNQKVWTWSCWFKRTKLADGSYNYLVSSYGNNDGIAAIYFDSSDRINTYFDTSGSNPYGSVNERKYRDTTAWMHIVWQVDAINGTQKIWINGVEESLSSSLNPPNFSYTMNQSGQLNAIGGAAWYPEGTGNNNYFAEIHFSDGNKYTPSDFAYTDAQTGQWRPKNGNVVKSNITYGTNGYWLDFRDNTSTTTLGYDYSGNGNHWTLNNMSVAAGADNDSLEDTPTNNFCTLNSLHKDSNTTLTDGNLKAAGSTSTEYNTNTQGTVAKSSGKWYYEVLYTSNGGGTNSDLPAIGWARTTLRPSDNPTTSGGLCYRPAKADYIDLDGNDTSNDKPQTSTGNVIQVAIDLDSGQIWFGNGGTYFESGNPSAGTNPTLTFTGGAETLSPFIRTLSSTFNFNFGQRAFSYTPPTGYRSLSSKNRATPVAAGVVRPQRFFDNLLYTGTGSSNSVTGLEFTPDLIWVKRRNANGNHHLLVDTIRGGTKSLQANTNDPENTNANRDMTFLANGIRWNSNTGNANASGGTYVVWCWKAGGASVSNTNGNITSSVSVNEESGFSIVSYTGNGSNGQTVGHGLSQAPQWIILKARDATQNWRVWHHKLAADGSKRLILDQNNVSENAGFLNDTAPTSTVFTLGNADDAWNANSAKFIAYCWHEVPGYSKFGSYEANGDSNGPYVHCGFRPAWVLIKNTSLAQPWVLMDNKINPYNLADTRLSPSSSDGDHTSGDNYIDFLADGFKVRSGSSTDINYSTSYPNHIFMAFAERPSETIFGRDANAR